MIRDLKSSNGTFVNGKQIEEATLKDGDRITIGAAVITVIERRQKGPSTMIRELQEEMDEGGKGYKTILRELVDDAEPPNQKIE